MKKLYLIFCLFLTIITNNYCTEKNYNAYIAKCSPYMKNTIAPLIISCIALWAAGEILVDMGHRYLACKKIASNYAQELYNDSEGILSADEVNFWAFIQGLSRVPLIWWREITATALLIAFIQATKEVMS